MANIYIIGVGGTGMRCIESFIHLCAIGMFDNTTVHMLALDTDKDNGNFKRLSELANSESRLKLPLSLSVSKANMWTVVLSNIPMAQR